MYLSIASGSCIGCGACLAHLPELIYENENALAYVRGDGQVTDHLLPRAEKAVRNCPLHIIYLDD